MRRRASFRKLPEFERGTIFGLMEYRHSLRESRFYLRVHARTRRKRGERGKLHFFNSDHTVIIL